MFDVRVSIDGGNPIMMRAVAAFGGQAVAKVVDILRCLYGNESDIAIVSVTQL